MYTLFPVADPGRTDASAAASSRPATPGRLGTSPAHPIEPAEQPHTARPSPTAAAQFLQMNAKNRRRRRRKQKQLLKPGWSHTAAAAKTRPRWWRRWSHRHHGAPTVLHGLPGACGTPERRVHLVAWFGVQHTTRYTTHDFATWNFSCAPNTAGRVATLPRSIALTNASLSPQHKRMFTAHHQRTNWSPIDEPSIRARAHRLIASSPASAASPTPPLTPPARLPQPTAQLPQARPVVEGYTARR